MGASMDLFFDVFANLKDDFVLSRITKISLDKGTHILIFSDDDLIVRVHDEGASPEYAYLVAAKRLVEWALRNEYNEYHASSSAKGISWTEKLMEQFDEVDNAKKGW